ncbi:MAG: 3'-5' exonuclease [Bacteroidota bacterium]
MNYIVLDLEATCWQYRSEHQQNEIIEIGALKVNATGQTVDEFAEFVQPKLDPTLSNFCKELTSISQSQVDNADTFEVVLGRFQEWINLREPFVLCSCFLS